MNITEVLVQPQAIAWLPWAVQYFFYIGSAYAAAILFLIALLFEKHTSHYFRSALVLTLAICAIVGPLALTADLHQPARAWHFFAYLTPWSWMSLGALFLPTFSGLAIATAWLYVRSDLIQLGFREGKFYQLLSKLSLGKWETSRPMILIMASITVLSGLSIAIYTGAEIAIVQARPLWHQLASPLLWFTSAFLGAIGFALIMWLLFSAKSVLNHVDLRIIRQSACISSILALMLLPIWASNNPSFSLYSTPQWVMNIAMMTVGLLVCLVISRLLLRANYRRIGLLLVAFCTLVVTWLIRWITIMEVQTIAKYDLGPYPYDLPMGSNGFLGIVGMLGLWFSLALLGSELLHTNTQTSHSKLTEH